MPSSLLRQLLSHGKQIFTTQDAQAVALQEGIALDQLNVILSRLASQGKVQRLRRGLYLVIGLLPEHMHVHHFVIANYLIQPSAISHWSALQYHGLTEQVPRIVMASVPHTIVTPSMRRKSSSHTKHAWEIEGVRYEYIAVQKKHFFGIENIWIDEHYQIAITDKERTLLDVFIFSWLFGGMGEAFGILESALSSIDIDKLISYAVKYDQKSLAKRLGWALEYFGISSERLQPLLNVPIKHYCRLDPMARAIGPCNKRWMIQNNMTKENNNDENLTRENSRRMPSKKCPPKRH